EAQDVGGEGKPLFSVGVEQRVRSAFQDTLEFPSEVVRILNTGVHSLPACWGMDVRGVACEEDAADAIARDHANVHVVERSPWRFGQHNIVALRALMDDALEDFERWFLLFFGVNLRLKLIGVGRR